MPLPPALAAKLAKRGLIQTATSASVKNREKENSDDKDKPRFVEEVFAESYDDPKGRGGERAATGVPSGAPLGLANRRAVSSGLTRFQRLGHYACPNKTNVHHTCSQFCVNKWGRGKPTPSPLYNKRRLKMLKKFPLPAGWIEIYDPGAGQYYYWDTETDDVCWTSPTYPKAKIGPAAADLRERLHEEELAAEANKPSDQELLKKSLIKLKKDKKKQAKDREELDPMDPASYSDVPRGTWASGLKSDEKSGVDTTASGPLFQQRPYPSPGDILKAQQKQKQ